MLLTVASLEAAYNHLGWPIFRSAYDLNFFGVRIAEGVDEWNDVLGVWYTTEAGHRVVEAWDATTDPGRPGLTGTPARPAGTAILARGYHRGLWRPGLHRNTYNCLVQARDVGVWRDGDRDGAVDAGGPLDVGHHALQVHHGAGAVRVGPYSLGCQVMRLPEDLRRLMDLVRFQSGHGHGTTLSYGLMDSADLQVA